MACQPRSLSDKSANTTSLRGLLVEHVTHILDLSVIRAVVATHASTPPATHDPPPRPSPASPSSKPAARLLADLPAAAAATLRLSALSAAFEGAPVDFAGLFSPTNDPYAPRRADDATLTFSPRGARPRRMCLEMRPWWMSMYARTASTSRRALSSLA